MKINLLFESVSQDTILKALRNRRLCAVTEYTSNVPGYGSVSQKRFGVVLALGVGRFEDELAIRFYQNNSRASWGSNQTPKKGSEYKILYLKDIAEFQILELTVNEAPSLFNPNDDKWFKEVIEIANFKSKSPVRPDDEKKTKDGTFKTDTEKDIEHMKSDLSSTTKADVSAFSKTTQERFKEVKSIANQALNLYNKFRRAGDEFNATEALKRFRAANDIANKYMATYKKEKKTTTEKNIKSELNH